MLFVLPVLEMSPGDSQQYLSLEMTKVPSFFPCVAFLYFLSALDGMVCHPDLPYQSSS